MIEDDADIRCTLHDLLNFEGYSVHLAENGLEALRSLDDSARMDQRFDLILLDLMMPIMNGWEFLDALQAKPWGTSIPILILSATKEETFPVPGVRGFIHKPVELDVLIQSVEQAIPRVA